MLKLDRQIVDLKSPEEMLDYIKALENLTSCLYELSAYRDSLVYGKRLATLMEQNTSFSASSEFSHYHAQAYNFCEKNCLRLGLYDDAIVYAEKCCDFSRVRYESDSTMINLHDLSVAYKRMGDAYYAIGELRQTEKWYLQAMEMDTQVDEELQSIVSA